MSKPNNPLNSHGFVKPGCPNDVAWSSYSILPELEEKAEVKVKDHGTKKRTLKIVAAAVGLLVIFLVLVSLPILLRPRQEDPRRFVDPDVQPVQLSGFVTIEGMTWSRDLSDHDSSKYKRTLADLENYLDEILRSSNLGEIYSKSEVKDLRLRSGSVLCEFRITLIGLETQDLSVNVKAMRERLFEDPEKELASNLIQGLERLRLEGKYLGHHHTFNIESLLTIVVQPSISSSSSSSTSLSSILNTQTVTQYKHKKNSPLVTSSQDSFNLLRSNIKTGPSFLAPMHGRSQRGAAKSGKRASSLARRVKRHVAKDEIMRKSNIPCLSPSCLSSSLVSPKPPHSRQETERFNTGQKQTSGWGEKVGPEKGDKSEPNDNMGIVQNSEWINNKSQAWMGNKTWGFDTTEKSNSTWIEKKPWGFDQSQPEKQIKNTTIANQSLKWIPEPHPSWVSNKTWGFDSPDMTQNLNNSRSSWAQNKTWGFSSSGQKWTLNSTTQRANLKANKSSTLEPKKHYQEWPQNRTWGFSTMKESISNSSWFQNKTWGFESYKTSSEETSENTWGSKSVVSQQPDSNSMTDKPNKTMTLQPFADWTQKKTWGFDQEINMKSNSSSFQERKWGFN